MLRTIFPPNVITVTATPDMWDGPLYPQEAAIIKQASLKRQREFIAGRRCAREALFQLGINNYPLLVGKKREPLWPRGIIGSLSHCDGFCGVVVACYGPLIGLGLDVEPLEPLGEDIKALVCTASEMAWLQSHESRGYRYWSKLIFSAKESVYKCYFPLAKSFLDFKEVEIQIDPRSRQFTAILVNGPSVALPEIDRLYGRFALNETHIYTGVTLPAADRSVIT